MVVTYKSSLLYCIIMHLRKFSDDQRKSYYESRKACHDIGGELTSINDHDELNFVHDHAHKFRNSAW